MKESQIIKRILLNKYRPDDLKDITPSELTDLVLSVLDYVKVIEKAIKDGKIKGDAGYTPIADKDYITTKTATKEINTVLERAVDNFQKEIDKAIAKVDKKAQSLKNGKDAEITEEQLEYAAQMASELIELPDFKALITQEPTAIRDSLELLQGDERLDKSAIKGIDESINALEQRLSRDITSLQTFPGGGKTNILIQEDGQDKSHAKVINFTGAVNVTTEGHKVNVDVTGGTGGSSIFVNTVEVTDPDFTNSSEIQFGVSTSTVTASLATGSIDVLKLDAGVQASLALADSALQSETDTLSSVTGRGASTSTESTFSGGLISTQLKANSSAGVLFESNSGTDVALFGAGGGAGATFYGGVNVDGTLQLYDSLQAGYASIVPEDDGFIFYNASSDISPITVGAVYASGTVFSADGSASAPSHSFSSDNNTGIFWVTHDTLAFSTGGVERLRIDSTGNVGIGTNAPSTKAEVYSPNLGETFTVNTNGSTIKFGAREIFGVSYPTITPYAKETTEPVLIQDGGMFLMGKGVLPDPLLLFISEDSITQGYFSFNSTTAGLTWTGGQFRIGSEARFDYRILLQSGNASNPSITFSSDNNTGIFRADADTLAFSTGGVERLRINSSLLTSSVDIVVPAETYGVSWNGSNEVPTKNDVYDKIETIVAGSGFTWTEVTGTTQSMAVNNGYIANNAALVTLTLPATAAVGSIIRVTGKGAGGWRIAQNASQQVIWNEGGVDGTDETTAGTGGRLDSTDDYDSIELICLTADTTWGVLSAKGIIDLV